jgi:hypothetical protein
LAVDSVLTRSMRRHVVGDFAASELDRPQRPSSRGFSKHSRASSAPHDRSRRPSNGLPPAAKPGSHTRDHPSRPRLRLKRTTCSPVGGCKV